MQTNCKHAYFYRELQGQDFSVQCHHCGDILERMPTIPSGREDTSLTSDAYAHGVSRTLVDPTDVRVPVLTPEQTSLVWDALGLAGECGEIADLVKKVVFHRQVADDGHAKKELGDCLWYITALARDFKTTLNEVMRGNLTKLEIRYPGGFDTSRSHAPGETPVEDRQTSGRPWIPGMTNTARPLLGQKKEEVGVEPE